jgi:(R)-2-hydroxyacyl-CoA dehydratese activating ATPase
MVDRRIVAGIDAGSTTIKISLYDGWKMDNFTAPTGWHPAEAVRELLEMAAAAWGTVIGELEYIVGTGYGRVCLDFIHKDLTEITCHARGAKQLHPGARTVIDVGGQDAKAMLITDAGRVEDFIMNDKCAAGTGRFLQVMATRLGMDVADTGKISPAAADAGCTINSMCTVFAESEVIGMINRGVSRPAIVQALIHSVAERIATMAARINPVPPAVFTGGMALNRALRLAIEHKLGFELVAPPAALHAGSIGAALIAWEMAVQINKEV